MSAIQVENLHKRYGSREVLRGVSLRVEQGEVFALLGPNGAGKTTLVEILEGYREPTAGSVRVLGFDPASDGPAYRQRFGMVLQSTSIDPELTVAEVVGLYAGFYPHPCPVDAVIELVGLTEKRNARVRALSGGQQRRVDLALGIVGDPDLIFLDEPTTGFDPAARRQAWEVVRGLAALGKTILLTTHYLDEAQELAGRVAVLVGGRIVAEGDPRTLGGRDAGLTTITLPLPAGCAAHDLPPSIGERAALEGQRLILRTPHPGEAVGAVVDWARTRRLDLDGLTVTRPSLEEVYLELTAETEAAHA